MTIEQEPPANLSDIADFINKSEISTRLFLAVEADDNDKNTFIFNDNPDADSTAEPPVVIKELGAAETGEDILGRICVKNVLLTTGKVRAVVFREAGHPLQRLPEQPTPPPVEPPPVEPPPVEPPTEELDGDPDTPDGPAKIRIYRRFLNLAENDNGSPETDYGSIYLYHDGNNKRKQVTLGRGFTQDGGNLWKVLQRYIAKGGGKAAFFAPYESRMNDGGLWQDDDFLNTLRGCSTEQVMRDAQDEVFDEVYLTPALNWAKTNQFTLPLSFAVVVDSYLHSGCMLPKLRSSFSERTPANNGNEKEWMQAYLNARLAWFTRASGALHTCMFRPQFFLAQISNNNWQLDCPLNVPGKGNIC